MNQGLLIGCVSVLTAAVTSGIWFFLRSRGSVTPQATPERDEVLSGYQARLQGIPVWNTIFSQLQAQLGAVCKVRKRGEPGERS